ncbi:hypothetical protein AAID98_00655 [Campylobacter coli]
MEHIIPTQNFEKYLPCWKEGDRKACQKDLLFTKMETDKQNLAPVMGKINRDENI